VERFTPMNKQTHSLHPDQKEKRVAKISLYREKNFKEIAAAYLYGSFVTSALFSDFDLGVLTQNDIGKTLNFELDLENQLERIVKYPVDVHVLNGEPLSFCQIVIRHRKVILDRKPNLRADLEGQILKQYFDFAYFQRRYLQEVVNAPL
jgi:predicted nucleotidyltransferase